MRKTPRSNGVRETVAYQTKNLRRDLRDRMRLLAVLLNTTMEDVLNRALVEGLPALALRHGVKLVGPATKARES